MHIANVGKLCQVSSHVKLVNQWVVRGMCGETLASKQNLIPRVDLSWSEDKIIETISKAAQSGGPGFFYLQNHGIDSSVFENAIHQTNRFYAKTSLKQKLKILNHGYAGAPPGKSSKGYVPPGIEGSYPKDGETQHRTQLKTFLRIVDFRCN